MKKDISVLKILFITFSTIQLSYTDSLIPDGQLPPDALKPTTGETPVRETKAETVERKTAEPTPTTNDPNYYPYNPPGGINNYYNQHYYYSQQYQQMYGYGQNPYGSVHNKVNVLLTSVFYVDAEKKDAKKTESDPIANMALWAHFSSESSLDFPREELKKQSELFLSKDGKTNIATRLAEINTEMSNLIFSEAPKNAKERAERQSKHDALLEEGRGLYQELSENLKGDEKKKLVADMGEKALAIPEVKAQIYNYGYGMGNHGGMGGVYPSYGTMGALGGTYYDTQEAKAYYDQVREQYRKLMEEAKSRQEELEKATERQLIESYFNRNR